MPDPNDIERLLQRRTDLSTFLIHFTRKSNSVAALEALVSILKAECIEARNSYGMAKDAPGQEVVCFTEAPLEQAWMMTSHINDRAIQMEPYGLVFTKVWARCRGVNPVWYIDMSPGHDWLTTPVDSMVADAVNGTGSEDILRLTPFLEQMGTWDHRKKEFWWEREWRHVGDLHFEWANLVAVFVPEAEHGRVRRRLKLIARRHELAVPALLDPAWGLERMISALADVPVSEAGPLPQNNGGRRL